MKSLIKRLEILNKSAELKIDYYRLSKLHQQQQQQEIQLQLLNNQVSLVFKIVVVDNMVSI